MIEGRVEDNTIKSKHNLARTESTILGWLYQKKGLGIGKVFLGVSYDASVLRHSML